MWIYEKKLEFPIQIKKPDLRVAKILMAQYGGPASELTAGLTYLSQRFSMPDDRVKACLTDVGTEELSHWEMIGTMLYQVMKGASIASIKAAGLDPYYVQHGPGVYPVDTSGVPYTAAYFTVLGDPIADITFDMAAEQNARATYEHILQLTDDPDVIAPIRFLREREIVHYQRFGECMMILEELGEKKR